MCFKPVIYYYNGEKLTAMTVDGEKVISRKEKEASIVQILESSGLDPLTSKVKVSVKGSSGLSSLFSILISFLPLIIFGSSMTLFLLKKESTLVLVLLK